MNQIYYKIDLIIIIKKKSMSKYKWLGERDAKWYS